MDDKLDYLLHLEYNDIKNWSAGQLYPTVRNIQKYARDRKNQVIRELKNRGIPTPTIYRAYKENLNSFSQSRLNFKLYKTRLNKEKQSRNYLLSLFFDAQNFLKAKTSTIEGWEDTLSKFEHTIQRHTRVDFNLGSLKNNKERFNNFFKLYNTLRAQNDHWKNLDSAQAFKEINEYMVKHPKMSYENLLKNLNKKTNEMYKKSKEREREFRKKYKIKDAFSFDDKV